MSLKSIEPLSALSTYQQPIGPFGQRLDIFLCHLRPELMQGTTWRKPRLSESEDILAGVDSEQVDMCHVSCTAQIGFDIIQGSACNDNLQPGNEGNNLCDV